MRSQIVVGATEMDLAGRIGDCMRRRGVEPSFSSLVQSGPNSANPHLGPGSRRVQSGEPVLFDFGAACGGYKADITRMAVIGSPDRRLTTIAAAVMAAHDAAIDVIRPGITAGEVDAAARAVLQASGLGEAFSHRLGHGLGLQAHEAPSLEPGSGLILAAGMVVTVEPGAYIPGWGGVRIEDDIVVTETGCRRLTRSMAGLAVIEAG